MPERSLCSSEGSCAAWRGQEIPLLKVLPLMTRQPMLESLVESLLSAIAFPVGVQNLKMPVAAGSPISSGRSGCAVHRWLVAASPNQSELPIHPCYPWEAVGPWPSRHTSCYQERGTGLF